ncbi:gluconokinase [Granulicoccus phenolivorans]|uniref:gluconokinase n=1 Tax=Granulicoccus phenolivorans TaxID=266854 RepID=UPI00054E2F07|nr:gluconokinase [Granulicoccus phenolivorans]
MGKSPLAGPRPNDRTEFAVPIDEAEGPLVMALDVGSTASRGGLHDLRGVPVRGFRHKLPHSFTVGADGSATIDAEQVTAELAQILDVVVTHPAVRDRIVAVALDTFATSLVGIDAEGRATTPCFTYADSRSADDLAQLRTEVDEAEVQQLTGARLHTSYLTPRFRWLRRAFPEEFARTVQWISLGEYAYRAWLGRAYAGTATAAWTGLLDRRTGQWSARMLELARIAPERLSGIGDEPLLGLLSQSALRWPALGEARWFAPIADGLAANVGSGGVDATTIVTSMATSGAMRVLLPRMPEVLPTGLWCYRIDDTRCLLGGALNDVGRALSWATGTFALTQDLATIAEWDASDATPVVLPFLSGERSTGWAGNARALFDGVGAATDSNSMTRGVLEGVIASYARVGAQLEQAAGEVTRVVCAGRVSQDVPGLTQLLADALDRPVLPATFKRSTLRGTALLASAVVDPAYKPAPPPLHEARIPDPAHRAHWQRVAERSAKLYAAAVG